MTPEDTLSQETITLLSAEALSAVFFVQNLLLPRWFTGFISANRASPAARNRLIVSLVLVGGLVLIASALLARQGSRQRERLTSVAQAATPLLAMWAVPALCRGLSYEGKTAELLVSTAIFVVIAELCFRKSLDSRPGQLLLARLRYAPEISPRIADAAALTLALTYCVVASWLSIRLHAKLLTSNFDLGLFENLFYNTLHGKQGLALGMSYFSVHAELILYLLVPIYAAAPRPETLLILQSVSLGLAGIPLYLLTARWLRSRSQALVLLLIYLLYPAVQGPNFYDFHFLTLSVLFVATAAYCLSRHKMVAFWISVAAALLCREDVALGVAAVGAGMALQNIRRRTGVVLAVVGAIWFLLIRFVWMPRFGSNFFVDYYADLVPPGEHGFGGVFRTLLSNPLYVLSTIVTKDKLALALILFSPLAFLPVRRWRTSFLLLPGFLILGLSTSNPAILQISFQYVCHFVPYVFIAAAAALAVRSWRERWPPLLAAVLGVVVLSFQLGIVRYDHLESGFQVVSFSWGPRDTRHAQDLQALLRLIPEGASLAAGEHEGPHAARRRTLLSAKDGPGGADFVLFGLRSLRWGGRDQIIAALESGEYGVVQRRGSFALLARGQRTEGNGDVVSWLRRADPDRDW